MPVLPDTGSSDLFVFGPSCTTCSLSNHSSYDPSTSSSFANFSSSWSLEYADGTVAGGYAASDTAGFGASSMVNVGVPFGVAAGVGGVGFAYSSRSGIMGLGLDGMSTMPMPSGEAKAKGATLFSRLVRAKALVQNVLSIRLEKGQARGGVVTKEGSGQYTFGGIEDEYVVGGRVGLTWAPVTSANYWYAQKDEAALSCPGA